MTLRLGLCCQFVDQPIRFRTTTATILLRLDRAQRLQKVGELCLANAVALAAAVEFCAQNGIGCFRVNSAFFPIKTHPLAGYALDELPRAAELRDALEACRKTADAHNVRLVFHPDQFVVLNSPRPEVVESSLRELEYQTEAAERIGADVINIHGGGAYGDKPTSLARLTDTLLQLPANIRQRLTLENDDRVYTPADLLPVCEQAGLPLVYDVHHHRCLPDALSEDEATRRALATWNREPLLHLSSPRGGWGTSRPQYHADYIDVADVPAGWRRLKRVVTVEVEAKAKELAVAKLRSDLAAKPARRVRTR